MKRKPPTGEHVLTTGTTAALSSPSRSDSSGNHSHGDRLPVSAASSLWRSIHFYPNKFPGRFESLCPKSSWNCGVFDGSEHVPHYCVHRSDPTAGVRQRPRSGGWPLGFVLGSPTHLAASHCVTDTPGSPLCYRPDSDRIYHTCSFWIDLLYENHFMLKSALLPRCALAFQTVADHNFSKLINSRCSRNKQGLQPAFSTDRRKV